MIFKRGFLFYKFFNIRLFFWLLFNQTDVVVSNDLDTLPAAFLASKLKKTPIVFDSHEYFTGVPELQARPFIKWVWKSFEKAIIPHLKYILTVSDSIAMQYKTEYAKDVVTVRNCSRDSSSIIPFSKQELGFRNEDLLLILQGTGINADRGGEELMEALVTSRNVSLMVVGSGDVIGKLKEKALDRDLSGRVKFFPKMEWALMMRYTKSADAGLTLDKDTNLNHRFSLPNKLFDYISAGIPVIAGRLPEVEKIIIHHNCGLIIPSITPFEINKVLTHLTDDNELLAELKRNAINASEIVRWEKESAIVSGFYKNVFEDLSKS